jgi:hypothetical protein
MEDIKEKILTLIVMAAMLIIIFIIGACVGAGVWLGLKCIFYLRVGPIFAAIVGGAVSLIWFLKKVKNE